MREQRWPRLRALPARAGTGKGGNRDAGAGPGLAEFPLQWNSTVLRYFTRSYGARPEFYAPGSLSYTRLFPMPAMHVRELHFIPLRTPEELYSPARVKRKNPHETFIHGLICPILPITPARLDESYSVSLARFPSRRRITLPNISLTIVVSLFFYFLTTSRFYLYTDIILGDFGLSKSTIIVSDHRRSIIDRRQNGHFICTAAL